MRVSARVNTGRSLARVKPRVRAMDCCVTRCWDDACRGLGQEIGQCLRLNSLALGAAPSIPYAYSGDGVTSVVAYPASMTVEEFETFPFPAGKVELVRGEPRVRPLAGASHGGVQSNLMLLLMPHVHAQGLGRVFTDGLCYELVALPRTVRNPDASFVRAERLPIGGLEPGFLKIAPDLAVEVLSPSDKAWEL